MGKLAMKMPAKIEHLAYKYFIISLIHSLIHLTCICSANHCVPGLRDPKKSKGEIPPGERVVASRKSSWRK